MPDPSLQFEALPRDLNRVRVLIRGEVARSATGSLSEK